MFILDVDTQRPRHLVVAQACWPACVGALAVVYAAIGDGAPARRSAIAWMIASWGARLTVQALYAPAAPLVLRTSYFRLSLLALLFSSPALFASRNPDPSMSTREIVAAIVWVVAFACETTTDRQMARFVSKAEHAGQVCRTGVWRVLPHAHAVFEGAIWITVAVFASASPWGWLAAACPVTMLHLLVTGRW